MLNGLHPCEGGRPNLVDDGHDARRFLRYGGRKRHGAAPGRAQAVAGAAYGSDAPRELIAGAWANAVIKPSAGRKNKLFFAPVVHANRRHIEPTIN